MTQYEGMFDIEGKTVNYISGIISTSTSYHMCLSPLPCLISCEQ